MLMHDPGLNAAVSGLHLNGSASRSVVASSFGLLVFAFRQNGCCAEVGNLGIGVLRKMLRGLDFGTNG